MDKMFQAALFDLDGVVLDTESQYTTFWAGVFERYYGDGETYAQKIKGQTLTQIYHAYFDGDQQRQQLITSQLVDFEHNMGFPYIPGFEAFVTSLRASGVRTAIVTSSASAYFDGDQQRQQLITSRRATRWRMSIEPIPNSSPTSTSS